MSGDTPACPCQVDCPACNAHLQCEARLLEQIVSCVKCGRRFRATARESQSPVVPAVVDWCPVDSNCTFSSESEATSGSARPNRRRRRAPRTSPSQIALAFVLVLLATVLLVSVVFVLGGHSGPKRSMARTGENSEGVARSHNRRTMGRTPDTGTRSDRYSFAHEPGVSPIHRLILQDLIHGLVRKRFYGTWHTRSRRVVQRQVMLPSRWTA